MTTFDTKPVLKLNPHPDGFGFLYGTATTPEGDTFTVNIMPPLTHWHGDMKLKDTPPHPTDWVIFIDGEEVGRVTQLDQANVALGPILQRLTGPER